MESQPSDPPAYSPLLAVVEAPPAGEAANGNDAPPQDDDVAGDVRRFRARLADALEAHMRHLLPELARRVLGRECACAEADLGAVVRAMLATHAARLPVRVRVAPCDAHRLRLDLPVLADPALRAGDVAIDVRDGAVEATRTARIAAFLDDEA